MIAHLLIAFLLQSSPSAASSPASVASTANERPKITNQLVNKIDEADPNALLKVKRIFVDNFGDDPISRELQAMIVSALVETKQFKVTEIRERADAVLKGVALEKTSQELHAYGEATSVGAAGGSGHSEINGAGSIISGSSSGGFAAQHMGINDSSVNTETINEARIAVRLVDEEGDVIWTTTQESKGGKYKGASADVADMCVKQLLKDISKLQVTAPSPSSSNTASTTKK